MGGMTMVEKVARSMCQRQGQNPDAASGCRWKLWEDDARAAIEAMREPTEAVLKAHRLADKHRHRHTATAKRDWSVMIDAALNEEPT